MKRLFSGILSVLILISVLSASMCAEIVALDLNAEPIESGTCKIEFTPNPLYANAPVQSNIELTPVETPLLDNFNPSDYSDVETGGIRLREQMKARNSQITLMVRSSSDVNTVAAQLFEIALEHTGVSTEGDYLAWQYGGYGGDVSCYTVSGMYYYELTLTVPYYTTAEQEAIMNTEVPKLLGQLDLDEASDYAKTKGVYDWICQNVSYDYDNLEDDSYKLKHAAYAALVDRTAVCQGYAVLFYRLMLELGVDNRVITGIGNGGPHAWNIVELNGLYYNLDSTWDAEKYGYSYFLTSDANFGDHQRDYEYTTSSFYAQYPMDTQNYQPDEFVITNGVLVQYNGNDSIVIIPNGVTEIGYGVFADKSMKSVILPEGLKIIGENAFLFCNNLTEITIPASVERIGPAAFLACYDLEKIIFMGDDTVIDDSPVTIPKDTVIYGNKGSAAEAYATKRSRTFKYIVTPGDLDGDGFIDRNDALYLLYHAIFGDEVYPVNQEVDFNGDGEVNSFDAIHLLYHSVFAESYSLR